VASGVSNPHPGSTHVELEAKSLRQFRWWEFTLHPEWLERHSCDENPYAPFAAGIPELVRIFFLPILGNFGLGNTLMPEEEFNRSAKEHLNDRIKGYPLPLSCFMDGIDHAPIHRHTSK